MSQFFIRVLLSCNQFQSFQPRLNPSRHHCTIAQAAQLALTFRILQPNKVLQGLGVFKAAFNWGVPVFIVEFDVTYYFNTVPRKGQQTFFCKNIRTGVLLCHTKFSI